MEVTKEHYIFWSILEGDMKTKIPHHIKNILSFYGFGNALVFKDITDRDIEEIQTYVRHDLPGTLDAQLAARQVTYTVQQKSALFGIFAAIPDGFHFTGGEIKLIKALSAHVKRVVDNPDENSNLQHFCGDSMSTKKQNLYARNMCDSVFGLIYGDMRSKTNAECTEKAEELTTKLFIAAKKQVEKFETELIKPNREFTQELVKVSICNEGKVTGTIICNFCADADPTGVVKVHCRSYDTATWSCSNIISHMSRRHMHKHQTNVKLQENVMNPSLNIAATKFAPLCRTNLANPDEYEDTMYDQLSAQVIKMVNISLQHGEVINEVALGAGSRNTEAFGQMKYCKIASDGDCLFSSVCHQLYLQKLSSKEHALAVKKLRAEVVEYIGANFEHFIHELKGRTYEKNPGVTSPRIEQECHRFLDEYLSFPGNWGGAETIKAVTELHNVNIVIINDDGSSNLQCNFDSNKNRSLIIFFHGPDNKGEMSNKDRLHYDSVVDVNEKRIAHISKLLSCAEIKRKNLTLGVAPIQID